LEKKEKNVKSVKKRVKAKNVKIPLSGQDTVSTDSRNDFLEVRKAVQFVLVVGVKTDFYVFCVSAEKSSTWCT